MPPIDQGDIGIFVVNGDAFIKQLGKVIDLISMLCGNFQDNIGQRLKKIVSKNKKQCKNRLNKSIIQTVNIKSWGYFMFRCEKCNLLFEGKYCSKCGEKAPDVESKSPLSFKMQIEMKDQQIQKLQAEKVELLKMQGIQSKKQLDPPPIVPTSLRNSPSQPQATEHVINPTYNPSTFSTPVRTPPVQPYTPINPTPPYTNRRSFAIPQMAVMRTPRLVIGIISIVLSGLILLQSCAAGVLNTLAANGEVSGSAGLLVAFLLLASGVVSISTRKTFIGGSLACAIMNGFAGLIGISNVGVFSDLLIWSSLCLILAVFYVICTYLNSSRQMSNKVLAIAFIAVLIGGGVFLGLYGKHLKQVTAPSQTSAPMDSGTLGKYSVAIKDGSLTTDYEGNPAFMVTFDFTNNSDQNMSFAAAIHEQAFQDGVALSMTILGSDVTSYDADSYMREVQPGGTTAIQLAYTTTSTNPITINVKELLSLDDTKLEKLFTLE